MNSPKQRNYIIAAVYPETYNTRVSKAQSHIRASEQASVEEISRGWRLRIPAGEAGTYRFAQMDNYNGLARRTFPWTPPLNLELRARAAGKVSPGTWGFGIWNDPYSFSLGFGSPRLMPASPNAAWFFFASPENHLSFNDDIPGTGALAATFSTKRSAIALLPFTPFVLPLLLWRPSAKGLRKAAAKLIQQAAISLSIDPTSWHKYALRWASNQVHFFVDDQEIFATSISPHPPLGLVIWLDNQYAAWHPDGRIAFGTLAASRDFWVEIQDINITSQDRLLKLTP